MISLITSKPAQTTGQEQIRERSHHVHLAAVLVTPPRSASGLAPMSLIGNHAPIRRWIMRQGLAEVAQPVLGLMALRNGIDRFTDQRALAAAVSLGQRL